MPRKPKQEAAGPAAEAESVLPQELVEISRLRPHPRNYKSHPPDQVEHIAQSLREHGQFRAVVVARDYTIIAGHGVVDGAKRAGWTKVLVSVAPVGPDDPAAMKIMVADNEIGHLARRDDRMLTELLRGVASRDATGLLGTGYDASTLAALVMVSRPASEIEDFDAAAEWTGLPAYEPTRPTIKLVLSFEDEAARAECLRRLGLALDPGAKSSWFPAREKDDLYSLKFKERGA
jgi:hypothetical protein